MRNVDPLCRQRFSGPNTGLHVNWAERGDISKQIISEFWCVRSTMIVAECKLT